jgi:hypothetical protein
MADLRDEKVVRASYLSQLIDLDGSDIKKVYEPVSNQIGFIVTFLLFLMLFHFAWKRYKGWREASTPQFIPYKVLKPPSSMIADQKESVEVEKKKKRVCAVVGATGFIGGHIVDELVRRKNCYVFALGRRFKPSKTNPDVDCVIQVDMLDVDGLTHAFQGVDSVFTAAAIIPTVFHTADVVYSRNRMAFTNILKAAKNADVKNLIHLSGFPMKKNPKDPAFAAFMNAFKAAEKDIIAANGEDGLQTCAIGPTNIIGLNSPIVDMILSGEMKSFPMSDALPISFMPVEYLVAALVNAEEKLAGGTDVSNIAGKMLPLRGEHMSWRALLTLPGWPSKISETSPFVMGCVIKLNSICATLFNKAPFGADVTPGIIELLEYIEDDVPEEDVQETYTALGVGPPHPPFAEYIPQLVENYKAKAEDKKDK